MTQQFTASDVRRTAAAIEDKQMLVSSMLRAFADLLETRERAVPVAYAAGLEANMRGFLDVMAWSEGEFTIPLYTHPSPANAERLAEALREFDGAFHKELADLTRIPEDDRGRINRPFAMDCVVGLRRCWDKLSATRAHSAQAQPPAASVTDAMVERGLEACIQDSDARLSRYKVVRSIIEAALAAQENPNG